MRAVDVNATVEAGSLVEIKLPRLRVVVEQRQAERLRDVLNTVLPPAANTGKVARTLRLLHLWGDVDPEISGPYDSDEDRLAAAQDYRRAHGEENGVFKLDVTGDVEADVRVESYTGGDLQMPKPTKLYEWVSSAWIEGRNALVVPSKDRQRFEMHAYETRNGAPAFAGKATFAHDGDAHHAGSIWTRTGEWDPDEAIRGCTLCKCDGDRRGLAACRCATTTPTTPRMTRAVRTACRCTPATGCATRLTGRGARSRGWISPRTPPTWRTAGAWASTRPASARSGCRARNCPRDPGRRVLPVLGNGHPRRP